MKFNSRYSVTGISIHAPRGGSDERDARGGTRYTISIHAPRGGSDLRQAFQLQKLYISIHAPRGGSDGCAMCA